MDRKKIVSSNKLLKEFPELTYYQLEYLVRSNQIKAKSFGKSKPRLYPPCTIDRIKAILKARNES
jgi:hypothetical protein